MTWCSLIKCCGDDTETVPPPRTSAIVHGRTSAAVTTARESLESLQPVNDPRTPTPAQTSQQAQPSDVIAKQQDAFQNLWLKAVMQVKASKDGEKLNEVMEIQKSSLPADGDITVTALFTSLQDEMKRVGLRGKLSDTMEEIVPYLNRFAIVGDVAISANPNPAAFPWAAVRFLLLNLTAGQDIRAKVIEGMAEMTVLVYQCSVYEEVHLSQREWNPYSTQEKLEEAIVESFAASIKLLGLALLRQRSATKVVTDAWKLEDFSGYLKELTAAKIRLHDAGHMCEMSRSSENNGILKGVYEVVRQEAIIMAEDRAKTQLKDLLIDPKDAIDHIYHPNNSFCLDGTRVALLQDIKNWAIDPQSPTVCWLPGLAGTGKSTIARTIARDLKGNSFGGAFFFKKGAGNRGSARFLFSVIAYQLAMNIPPLYRSIVDAVRRDDSLAVAPKDVQWRRLMREPLVALQRTGFRKPLLLVIDALDECEEDDRGEILTLLASCPTTLKVFITSRPELDIEGHFAKTKLHREIVLHRVDPGTVEQDITTFIRHAISHFMLEYNRAHPQECMQLQPNWPGNDRTQLLTSRSLPLFIAAATFIRMIKDCYWTRSPDEKIDFIIETSAQVHSQYDPLYRPVLSLILSRSPEDDHDDITENFTVIIGSFVLLANSLSVISLANLLNVEPRVVFGQVDPLRSVIDVPSDDSPLRLFHLSFRDYLVSKSAGVLQVNETKTHETLAIKCFELMKSKLKRDMCGLGYPGKSRYDINNEIISKCIPSEVQYACRYWAHHLNLSGAFFGDGDKDYYNNILSDFRNKLFLTWLEVFCLTGKLSEAVEIIIEVRGLGHGDEKEKNRQFCHDAIHFVRYFLDCISHTPLQLYNSCVMFAPRLSIAPQAFNQRQYPEWVSGACNGDQAWSQGDQMLHTHNRIISDMTFLQNGRLVSVARKGEVEVWDPASGRCLHSCSLDSEDRDLRLLTPWKSSTIAIVTRKGIRICDLDNGYCYPELVPTPSEGIKSLAFSDNGKLLGVCGSTWDSEAKYCVPTMHIWDLETKKCLREIRPLPDLSFTLSHQGQWIATTREKSLIFSHWNGLQDISWNVLGECEELDKLNFSPDGKLIASHRTHLVHFPLRVWSLKTQQCLYKFEIYATDIALSSNRLAIGHAIHGATIVDLETGLVCHKTNDGEYSNIAISHDGGYLASRYSLASISTWDLTAATPVDELHYHKTPVQLITLIVDDNTILATTSSDVKVWDIAIQMCKETCEFSRVRHIDQRSLTSARRAPYFAVEGYSGIEIWQIAPLRLKELIKTEGFISCLSMSDDGQRLVVGCDTTVEIWDLTTFSRTDILTATSGIMTVAPSTDGSLVAFATQQLIEVWKLPGTRVLKVSPAEAQPILTLALREQRLMWYTRKLHVWDIEASKLLLEWEPDSDDDTPVVHESFFNFSTVTDPVDPSYAVLKPFHITRHGDWVVKGGKRVLWLPPAYRIDIDNPMAIFTRSTIVIGSKSGRVLFLPLKH